MIPNFLTPTSIIAKKKSSQSATCEATEEKTLIVPQGEENERERRKCVTSIQAFVAVAVVVISRPLGNKTSSSVTDKGARRNIHTRRGCRK